MNQPTREQLAVQASEQASRAGWYLIYNNGFLFAVNPHNSSEVWTFYPDHNEWRRKGDEHRHDMPIASE